MSSQIDLNNWSSSSNKISVQLPYVEILKVQRHTPGALNIIKEPVDKSLAIYVRKNDKVFKVKDVEFNLETIKLIIDTCGSININLDGNEHTVNNMKEVLSLYGYNDNDSSSTTNANDVSNGNDTSEQLDEIFG